MLVPCIDWIVMSQSPLMLVCANAGPAVSSAARTKVAVFMVLDSCASILLSYPGDRSARNAPCPTLPMVAVPVMLSPFTVPDIVTFNSRFPSVIVHDNLT